MNFTVTVQPSGRQFEVARDEVMLPAAIRQGIVPVDVTCLP